MNNSQIQAWKTLRGGHMKVEGMGDNKNLIIYFIFQT
jgi:hypothetical protein